MAGTNMALRRGAIENGDDVQSSIELLDRVLSEFDDLENANQVQNNQQVVDENPKTPGTPGNISSTPEDEISSLCGHQSEDDGYMSMNGRKTGFTMSFKPLSEHTVHHEEQDFPPPPQEAERIIATLLPRASPANSSKRQNRRTRTQNQSVQSIDSIPMKEKWPTDIRHFVNNEESAVNTATQTTLPKTRHQRPYGWELDKPPKTFHLHPLPTDTHYNSLPLSHILLSPQRIHPPITNPEKFNRNTSDDLSSDSEDVNAPPLVLLQPNEDLADDERFSDDSLEELLPPPPPLINKRSSIAWEVSLDQNEEFLIPGSTKVIGKRKKCSGENSQSSTSSIPRLKDLDDWPEPPNCSTEDEVISPFSDSDDPVNLPQEITTQNLTKNGTYVIRRGRKLHKPISDSNFSVDSSNPTDFRPKSSNSRYSVELNLPNSTNFANSKTFDNIKSFTKEELANKSQKSHYNIEIFEKSCTTPEIKSFENNEIPSNSSKSRQNVEKCFPKHTSPKLQKTCMKFLVKDTFSSPEEDLRLTSPKTRFSVDLNFPKSPELEKNTKTNIIKSLERKSVESFKSPDEVKKDFCKSRYKNTQDFDKYSKTFDDLKSLEGIQESLESCEKISSDFPNSLAMPRVISLPAMPSEKNEENGHKRELPTTVEEEESLEGLEGVEVSPLRKIERNISELLERRDFKDFHMDGKCYKKKDRKTGFQNNLEIIDDFPPLPPSPLEENEDEYSEIFLVTNEPPILHSSSFNSSLKTRSMDNGISKGKRRNVLNNTSKKIEICERKTLPTDFSGTRRRNFCGKKFSSSPREEKQMQTSCSLPETPIFARGCDIMRTPYRRGADCQTNRSTHRTLDSLASSSSYRRGLSNTNLEQALVGAEMLRLAGGPGRGWYPRHRQNRPASIENLDRLTPSHSFGDSAYRKPQTLPPNLTPKFFQRSPRDALRRVTSLLIRKGNNNKESKREKEQQQQQQQQQQTHQHSNTPASSEEGPKKKGFFKNFWKRTRHYSLEQQ